MTELKTMTTSELRRFVSVTEIALKHARNTTDSKLATAAQRDIDEATRELARRS
ncbi:hypothetical protein ACFY7H_13075 [Streptomyces sp. NPDC012794]|uniref:hypothetical protein n=1 Tax=Streptomyces sp. NPDC012794 TaxID=3364850 RepID=UPI0036AF5EA1